MNIKEIGRCSMFSSDFKENFIIYTEFDGSIHFQDKKLTNVDSYKKFIKFYPTDSYVFTTTGTRGLTVWERETGKEIYSYPRENLFDHSYSKNCILASFDEFNIKFYDLRTRYLINSFQQPNLKKIEWCEQYLYCLDDTKLSIIDYRKGGNSVLDINEVLDFCICNGNCYYLTKKLKSSHSHTKVLSEMFLNDANKVEVLEKDVSYKSIQTIFDNSKIAGILNNGFKIESQGNIESFHFNNISPIKIHLSKDLGYLFTSSHLYKLQGSID